MQLNLGTKKNFSEANMRRIISILTGLMSSVSSLEDQCIKEYDDTVTYQKGQIVIGSDGYFYEAKTVATGTWDASKWTKIGTDDITELDLDTIKSYLGLTQQQLDTLASIISTEIRLDKCFSSSDTYMRIQDALKEAKQYCITELAKKSTGSFKKANDVSEVTDGNYLYLIFNNGTSKYDIYALVDSNVELLTSVDVNLDDFYTKQEITDNYYDKATSDGKYATITTVDGKVNKTDIVDNLTSTDTDKPLSANQGKVLKDEVDLKAKDSEVVKKTDIVTTIDATSTDDKVPTAKAMYNKSKNKIASVPDGTDIIAYTDSISKEEVTETVRIMNSVNSPYGVDNTNNDFYYTIYNILDSKFKRVVAYDIRKNDMYMIMKNGGNWGTWQRVCTTSVADVPVTNITTNLVSTKVALDNSDSYATYYVKSGTCYVTIWSLRLIEACSVETIFNGLPKSTIGVTCPLCNGVESFAQVFMSPNSGVIAFNANASLVNKSGYCSFSYPVAES